VLVGHSFGGLTARLYAQRHPTEVSGLVLLDPASPEDWRNPSDERRAQLARANTLCRHGERAARLRVTDLIVALVRLGALDLARGFGRLVSFGAYSRADDGVLVPVAKLPPDVLDIAIRSWTRGKFFEALGSQISSISASAAEVSDDQDFGSLPLVVVSSDINSDPRQLALHARLAARSRRGRHVVASGSSHWIPLDRPDVVVAAVRDVLTLAGTPASTL
jgi:pimeloyl-ACP methyl ester carboxylesterase